MIVQFRVNHIGIDDICSVLDQSLFDRHGFSFFIRCDIPVPHTAHMEEMIGKYPFSYRGPQLIGTLQSRILNQNIQVNHAIRCQIDQVRVDTQILVRSNHIWSPFPILLAFLNNPVIVEKLALVIQFLHIEIIVNLLGHIQKQLLIGIIALLRHNCSSKQLKESILERNGLITRQVLINIFCNLFHLMITGIHRVQVCMKLLNALPRIVIIL